MVYEIEGEVIYTADFPSVKAVYYLARRDYVNFLANYILDWTLPEPITPTVIAKLKWNAIKVIIDDALGLLKQLEEDTSAIYSGLEAVIMSEGKRRLLPQHPLMQRYADRLRLCMPAVDNECNLITLPSGHNIETMRYDDFVIVEAIITAKNKALDRKMKQNRR